jgi:hypothetical protein
MASATAHTKASPVIHRARVNLETGTVLAANELGGGAFARGDVWRDHNNDFGLVV